MKWWLPWRSCDPLSSAAREAASRSGCESLGEGKKGLTLWRQSSWSRLPRWEGPGASRGSDLDLAELGSGAGIGPVVLAGLEGVPP